jgi:hypothetical protein
MIAELIIDAKTVVICFSLYYIASKKVKPSLPSIHIT